MRKEATAARTAISAARQRLTQAEESGQDAETVATLRARYREELVRHWPTIDAELTILGRAPNKQSGSAVSSLGSQILQRKPADGLSAAAIPEADRGKYVSADTYNALLADAQRLAGSVMGQDQTKGQDHGKRR